MCVWLPVCYTVCRYPGNVRVLAVLLGSSHLLSMGLIDQAVLTKMSLQMIANNSQNSNDNNNINNKAITVKQQIRESGGVGVFSIFRDGNDVKFTLLIQNRQKVE